MPTLAESDVESDSDCDSLPDQDAVSEAGGGNSVFSDLWSDHPIQQVDEPAPLPRPLDKSPDEVTTTPSKDSSNSPEEDKYERTPGGRSKRERKLVKYKCHLGDKQIPPGMRRIAPKCRKHKQRMSERRQMGDEMMLRAEVDIPIC